MSSFGKSSPKKPRSCKRNAVGNPWTTVDLELVQNLDQNSWGFEVPNELVTVLGLIQPECFETFDHLRSSYLEASANFSCKSWSRAQFLGHLFFSNGQVINSTRLHTAYHFQIVFQAFDISWILLSLGACGQQASRPGRSSISRPRVARLLCKPWVDHGLK